MEIFYIVALVYHQQLLSSDEVIQKNHLLLLSLQTSHILNTLIKRNYLRS